MALSERRPIGRFCLIDDADYEWAADGRWPYCVRRGRGIAGGRGNVLHREIARRAGLMTVRQIIFHHNGWSLDNRRSNLIVEQHGRHKAVRNIHRNKLGWRVQIGSELIGRYDAEDVAIAAHESAARERGYLTPALQAELLEPVIRQLESWVAEGLLVRHVPNAPLIEDRYRLRI